MHPTLEPSKVGSFEFQEIASALNCVIVHGVMIIVEANKIHCTEVFGLMTRYTRISRRLSIVTDPGSKCL